MLPCFLRARTARLALAFCGVSLLLVTQGKAQAPAKRPINHGDYDAWRGIYGQRISRDGQFVAYALVPQDGDGEVVVRNLKTGAEWRHPRGGRGFLPTPATKTSAAPPSEPTGDSPLVFSGDGKYLLFQITPTKAELDQAKKSKKADDAPKNDLGLMELATGKVARLAGVRRFQTPEDAGNFFVYQREPEKGKDPAPEKKPQPMAGDKKGKKGLPPTTASTLVLRNLADGSERAFDDVLDFSLAKDGKTLVFTTSSKTAEKNGVFAFGPGFSQEPATLFRGPGKHLRLTWDEKQTQIAFLSNRDDSKAAQPKFTLYHWKRSVTEVPGGEALPLITPETPGFKAGMVLSSTASISFAEDGSRVFVGVGPEPPPEVQDDKGQEKVVVELWHWKDDFIQPMQKMRAGQEKSRTYRAVVDLADKKFIQLADTTLADVIPNKKGDWALGHDDKPYRHLVGQDATYGDYYLVNTRDGSRKPLLKKQAVPLSWSPGGRYLLAFDGKDWSSIHVGDGKTTNLTSKLKVRFAVEDWDMPSTPAPYGVAGWTTDDKHVLLYDRYDIWQFTPDGSLAHNLSQGSGRKEQLQFRTIRLDFKVKSFDPSQPLLLKAEDQRTRDSGFYRVRFDGAAPQKLLMAAKSFSIPQKAKDADVLLLTAQTFSAFPDLHATRSDFSNLKKISHADPQQAGLLWGKAELVPFKNLDGAALSGILLKPENFDAAKKYPMIVYIYEKLSQNLHHFVDPRPGTSINPTYYTSNGYLVFMPDIVYTIGQPGQSALKCVLPGIQAVVDKGCVDEQAIGIQGHSWGGYQIAYMVTQTQRFKAACAGAPVANMTSAYSGIRWGTGLPRQFQYERTQSRIGGSLWEYPMRFVENSPVFQADRVKTPVLMLHNDADDAVPWYQGIEYYLALRRLGKEVYLFNYPGELHGLRKRANQQDYTVRMQQFFDHHLRGAPKPDWMERGIPYQPRGPVPATVDE